MKKNIKEKKKKMIKEAILKAAEEIVSEDGFDKVSIRKIADKIAYSPGSIYQYFNSKDEIMLKLIENGYQNILKELKAEPENDLTAAEEIKLRFRDYIKAALKHPEYYKAVMLSENEKIKEKTAVLKIKDISESQSLNILKKLLKKGVENAQFKRLNLDLRTKVIWSSVFGLIIRLIIEDLSQEEENILIEEELEMIISAIRTEKK